MHKYTKAILALAGVLLPFLESIGAPLPEFLTLDWLQGIILAVTPVLVFYFPNTDNLGNNIRLNSPAAVGVLALLLSCLALSGCAGTAAAYREAAKQPDALDATAKVISEHYFALVREANELAERGVLSDSALAHAQDVVRVTEPVILELGDAAQLYKAVRSSSNAAELERALSNAAMAVARLLDFIKPRRTSSLIDAIERDLERILASLPILTAAA